MKALLIIDMQKGSFTAATPRYKAKEVIDHINLISEKFREYKKAVIYIQHDGSGSGEFEKNSTAWEILDELNQRETDSKIDKYANDVFYESQLQSILNELKIDTLFLCGCATDFCVESTVQSALSKNYNICIVEDGHTTADRPHAKAEQLIAHYNWVWQNMLPTKGQIRVANTKDILSDFK